VDVKIFFFFLSKLGSNVRKIAGNGRMIIVPVTSLKSKGRAIKHPFDGYSFCHDAKTALKISWR
jgi:hypothetical protein